jgi:hypothetical protein
VSVLVKFSEVVSAVLAWIEILCPVEGAVIEVVSALVGVSVEAVSVVGSVVEAVSSAGAFVEDVSVETFRISVVFFARAPVRFPCICFDSR